MKNLYTFLFVLLSVCSVFASSGGKAGKTGSPGENTCTQCHGDFALNSGGGSVSITSPNLTGWSYTPGQTYTINVTVSKSGVQLFGLGFESLLSTGANAGTLVITNSVETHLLSANVSGSSRTNVVQETDGGASSNSHTFSFNWVAPSSGAGNLTFYAVGMACDNTGGTGGDYVYTTTQIVSEATVVNPPVAGFTAVSTNICENGSITFTDQSTNSPTSWLWDFGDGQTSGVQNPSHTYTTAGTYTVSLTATNTGGSNTSTMNNYIIVNAAAPVTISQNGNTLTSDAGSGNQWYDSNGIINGENGQTFSPSVNGDYYTIVTDVNGCTATSNTINFIYVGVSDATYDMGLTIYPNPVVDYLIIESKVEIEGVQIIIMDTQGRVIRTFNATAGKSVIDMHDVSRGVYFLKIISDNKSELLKIIK